MIGYSLISLADGPLYHPVSSADIKDKYRKPTIFLLMLFFSYLLRENKQNVTTKKIIFFFLVKCGCLLRCHTITVACFCCSLFLSKHEFTGRGGMEGSRFGRLWNWKSALSPAASIGTQAPLFACCAETSIAFSPLCRCYWCK